MALQPNTNGDGASIAPLEEGVTALRWSPTSNFLTATSWDGNAFLWDVKSHTVAEPKLCQNLGAPALCASWAPDGARLFFGGCSANARIWDLASNTVSPIGKHDDSIRHMVALPSMLVTASWDKSVRYWDVRAPSATPMGGVMTGDKVFAMDALGNLCVVGTASRRIIIYDLRKPTVEYKAYESPLKYQTRSIACFTDMSGYAAGSIEGRVAIQYIEEQSKNFVFKCHRAGQNSREVYAVNDIHFNQLGTFATVGSDGTCNFWDKEQRSRLKAFNRCSDTISCCRFSATSQYFAYAVSYDWSMGAQGYNATKKNHILIHEVQEKEVKPKPKAK